MCNEQRCKYCMVDALSGVWGILGDTTSAANLADKFELLHDNHI